MTSRDFCYWVQGLFELQNPKTLNEKQTELIRRHLAMVFKHEIDPSFPDKEELSKIHNPEKEKIPLDRLEKDPFEHMKPRGGSHPSGEQVFMC